MDVMTLAVVVVAIFALVVVAILLVFRQRASGKIQGPLGTGLEWDAANAPPPTTPAVKVKKVESRGGGLLAEDRTGRGVDLKDVKVQDDILASSEPPTGKQDPKA